MDVALARVLFVALLSVVSVGCQGGLRASPRDSSEQLAAARVAASDSGGIATVEAGPRDYSTELAMGARCPAGGSQASQMTWPIRGACTGPGPAHLMKVMHALEPSIRWSEASLNALKAARQSYIAVPGIGKRPDFFMVLESVWIRSFEGHEDKHTVYLVQAPFCQTSSARMTAPIRDAHCLGVYDLRAYVVSFSGEIVDVTSEKLPLRPRLTAAERRRYGPYMASSLSEATDEEIELQLERLQYVPTMRWAIGSFDPETPLPRTDPRHQGSLGQAHFGFLVWDGHRFQLLDRVPRSMWPSLNFEEAWRSTADSASFLFDSYVYENAH